MVRTFLAIIFGKFIFFLSRSLGLGGGFAAPGLYALKIDPELVKNLSSQISKNIIVTGTNGKTTTASMLSHLFHEDGEFVIRNKTGSNLERGIASVLINHSSIFGKIKEKTAVWEVDEAAFNTLAPKLNPDLVIFLNVYRDQLDRYGEVDSIVNKWIETMSKLPHKTKFLINGDDGSLSKLINPGINAETFTVEGLIIPGEGKIDGIKKSKFTASQLESTFSTTNFIFKTKNLTIPVSLSIPGNYNACNAVGALSAKFLMGGLSEKAARSLTNLKSSFGRSEKFVWKNKECFIFLIKNPVGATQVLGTVIKDLKDDDTLLLVLNDNFADGTDVSWIWDIDLESVKNQVSGVKIIVTGQRAYDMALRLKYAEVENLEVEGDLKGAFKKAIDETKGRLFILPTYTALMQIQKILVSKGIRKEYWKE